MAFLTLRSAPIPTGATTVGDEQAYRAAHGWDLAQAAATLLDGFDRDHDGMLDDTRFLGFRFFSEARTRTSEVAFTAGFLVGRPEIGLARVTDTTSWSLDRLVQRADANRDQIVTAFEIAQVLRSYDADADGRLSVDEFRRARYEVGAESRGQSRVVEAVGRGPRR